jgi:hypothetical protein
VGDSGYPAASDWWEGKWKGEQKEECRKGWKERRGSDERSGRRGGRRSNGGSTGGWLLNNGGSYLIRWRLISRIKRRESVRVREGSWGFCSQKDLGRGARGAERRLRAEIREGLDIGNLLPLSSAFTEVNKERWWEIRDSGL